MHACMHALCWRSLPRGHPSPAMLLVKPTRAFLPSMPMAKHAHPTGTPRGCKRLFLSVSPMIQEVQKFVAGAGMEVRFCPLFRFGLLLFLVSTIFVSHFFPLKTKATKLVYLEQTQPIHLGLTRGCRLCLGGPAAFCLCHSLAPGRGTFRSLAAKAKD